MGIVKKLIQKSKKCADKKKTYIDNPDQTNKQKFNQLIKHHLQEKEDYFINIDAKHLILDSTLLNTTNMLLDLGVNKENIMIVEQNKDTAKYHRQNKLNCFCRKLEHFLMNKNKYGAFDSLIFDLTGKIPNQSHHAFLALKNGYIFDNTLLVMTFCKRGGNGNNFVKNKENFINNLKKAANLLRFNVIEKDFYEYGGGRGKSQPAMGSIYLLFKIKN
jgi:hypothetical protein